MGRRESAASATEHDQTAFEYEQYSERLMAAIMGMLRWRTREMGKTDDVQLAIQADSAGVAPGWAGALAWPGQEGMPRAGCH